MAAVISLLWPGLLGALSVLGFAPYGYFWLPILTLALLLARVEQVALDRPGRMRATFVQGYVFGLGFFLAGVSWVYISLHSFGDMPAVLAGLATFLFCAFLALFPAVALVVTIRFTTSGALRLLLAWPASWVLLEGLRGAVFTGFPWLALGYSQVPGSPLVGYAAVLGVFGVSAGVALTAGALLVARKPGGRWALWLIVSLWLGGAGLQRVAWTQSEGGSVKVSLVQGNVAQERKFAEAQLTESLLDYLHWVRRAEGQLTVLPETALPILWDQVPPAYRTALANAARERGGDVLFGVPEAEVSVEAQATAPSGTEPEPRYYNSVLSLGVAPAQTYRKVHLVAFGEYLPPGFDWVAEVLHIPFSAFSRGAPTQPPLAVAGQQVAVNICYEDAFGEEVLHALPRATLFVNVSNDAWFGASAAPWQHLQMAQMRALETGRPWLRANNTGITAVIAPDGQVTAQLPPFTRGLLEAEVHGYQGTTPYVRWGNGVALGAAAIGFVLAAGFGRRWTSRRIPAP